MGIKLPWDMRTLVEDYARSLHTFLDMKNIREDLTEAVINGLVKNNRESLRNKTDVVDILTLIKRLEKRTTDSKN